MYSDVFGTNLTRGAKGKELFFAANSGGSARRLDHKLIGKTNLNRLRAQSSLRRVTRVYTTGVQLHNFIQVAA